MTKENQKVTVFASDAQDAAEIALVAGKLPNVTLENKNMTLTQANGTAHALVAAGDIILFRTTQSSDDDVQAAQNLCQSAPNGARIIAISDPDLSLSEARKLMHAGIVDVLPMPLREQDLSEVLNRMTMQPVVAQQLTQRGKIITVAQARGGVGGTTVAVNLADALQGTSGMFRKSTQSRVALVDLDLQFGGIASFLDIDPNDTLSRMAKEGTVPDATFLSQAMQTTKGGLSVLTAPTEFVPLESLSREQIEALLDQLSLQYDFVVVDLPRTLVHWVQAVLNGSDQLFLVTDSTVPAIRQSKRLIDAYLEENPTLRIDMVINLEAKPMIKGRHHQQAAKLLERDLVHWLPPDPKTTRDALDRGVPLSVNGGRSRLTKAIQKIAKDVTSDEPPISPRTSAQPEAATGDFAFKTTQRH